MGMGLGPRRVAGVTRMKRTGVDPALEDVAIALYLGAVRQRFDTGYPSLLAGWFELRAETRASWRERARRVRGLINETEKG